MQASLLAPGRQGGPWGAACPLGVPMAPCDPPPAPQTLLAVPLSQGGLCLGGEVGGTGLRGVSGPGPAAAASCPRWLSSPAGVTRPHPCGVATVTGHRARRLGPAPTPGPGTLLPTHHGAVGSYWEELGSRWGASTPCGGCATGWGPLGNGGGLVPMGAETGGGPYPPPAAGVWHLSPLSLEDTRGWLWVPAVPGSCGWPACSRRDIPAPWVPAVPGMWGDAPSVPPPCLTPPRRVAEAAAANSSPRPLPHLGNIWAGEGGKVGLPSGAGAFGGQDAAGGDTGSRKRPGLRDEGGRCQGDSTRAGPAAKGCGLMRRTELARGGWGRGGVWGSVLLSRAHPCPASGTGVGGPILGCRWGPLGWRPPEIVTCASCTLRRGMALPGPLQGILGGTRLGAPTHVGTAHWSNNPPPHPPHPIPLLQGGRGGHREGCRDGAHTPRLVPAVLLGSCL